METPWEAVAQSGGLRWLAGVSECSPLALQTGACSLRRPGTREPEGGDLWEGGHLRAVAT